jgi:alpha-methylacyl-CoA racemase
VLSDLGATVDKIEDTGAGDYLRFAGPQAAGFGLAFAALNRGKRSAVVDLKHERGREAFLRLAGSYDVLLEQFRPGVLERLGLGHALLRAAHPRLVICALTGYGQNGPLRDRAGHDLNYLARAGLLAMQGPVDRPPQVPAVQLADVSGGMWCAIAILAALRHRDASGEGAVIDVAMSDGVLGFATLGVSAALGGQPPPRGADYLTGGIAPYGTYFSADGAPMTLAALEPKFWLRFAAANGLEPDTEALLPGPHQAAWREKVAAVFAGRTRAEWEAFAAEHDCCVEPALEPSEIANDAHLAARGALAEVTTGEGQVPVFRTPVTPRDADLAPPPRPGEHTRAVFAEAGFADGEIDELIACGALRD